MNQQDEDRKDEEKKINKSKCPECGGLVRADSGCMSCLECGWSGCAVA